MEKFNPIVLTDTDTNEKYTLEFTRDTVKFAESRGFKIEEIADMPMTKSIELFWYAFRAHHMSVSREKAEKILIDDLKGFPDGMIERLYNLYRQPFNALVRDEDASKNARMTVEM